MTEEIYSIDNSTAKLTSLKKKERKTEKNISHEFIFQIFSQVKDLQYIRATLFNHSRKTIEINYDDNKTHF